VITRWLSLLVLVPLILACNFVRVPAGGPAVRLTGADGKTHDVKVELAATAQERGHGLMERQTMPEDAGMLFVFPSDTDNPFWMKDTLLPLSIAWIAADGTIVDIQDMQPQTTDLHQPRARYRYALEVNQGYFARAGIKPGDRAELPALPAAA
jgi:uncharacterized membrane protein (UPF0127 family)